MPCTGPFPEALAQVHAEFERIHPFLDGNGRAGRLLTNLLLIRMGYPPAIIRKAERTRYLSSLRRADGGGLRATRRASGASCARHSHALHRAGRGGPRETGPAGLPRHARPLRPGAAGCRRARTPSCTSGRAWPVAEHSELGHPVSQEQVSARGIEENLVRIASGAPLDRRATAPDRDRSRRPWPAGG